jgi:hypothetical protein
MVIDRINLAKGQPYKDFGRGFYTTQYREQALAMARRTVRVFKGGVPTITVFSLDDTVFGNVSLRIRTFYEPNNEWANFVINNRNAGRQDTSSLECNLDNKYDIVSGPVANDDIVLQLRLFLRGLISIPDLKKNLEYKELTSQISFHTEAAIQLLVKTEVLHG